MNKKDRFPLKIYKMTKNKNMKLFKKAKRQPRVTEDVRNEREVLTSQKFDIFENGKKCTP